MNSPEYTELRKDIKDLGGKIDKVIEGHGQRIARVEVITGIVIAVVIGSIVAFVRNGPA